MTKMKITVEILPDGRRARLIEPIHVVTHAGEITVPHGFVTDFASVPRAFWHVIPPWGKYSLAAVVHDYLYFTGEVSRKAADQVFLEQMRLLGVPWWKRRLMYYAVRWFGGAAWENNRKRS
jgi:hypothetical protein